MTRVIGVISGKGGVGKSTVAMNLALALKRFGKSVVLMDCNLSTPHLSYYLGTSDYNWTVNDVLNERKELNSALYNYNGIKYLPASVKFDDLLGVQMSRFKKVLLKVDKKTDFVILDAAPGLGKEALSIMDACSEILFVTAPFVPMLGDVIRCKEVLGELGEKKMGIVLNMVTHNNYELKKEVVEKLVELPVMAEIPHDKEVLHSLVMRTPVIDYKPSSLASINFMRLASLMTEQDYDVPLKVKLHKLATNIRNMLTPSSISMPTKVEDVKKELLSNF
ncbi:MAG: P-loop NTPase [Candidatus Aenigmarchaeota archaeon]|nr:P-loop NTPase [Candidatus Aenigmarchaeota archaeon]